MVAKDRCCRCWKSTPAEVVGEFSYEGIDYRVPLCDEHSRLFDQQMMSWTRLAEEIGERNKPRRIGVATNGTIPRPASTATKPPVSMPEFGEPRYDNGGPSEYAMSFQFTTHAEERMELREITRRTVFDLIDSRNKIRRVGSEPDTHVYMSDGISVVVNEDERIVVTVARR